MLCILLYRNSIWVIRDPFNMILVIYFKLKNICIWLWWGSKCEWTTVSCIIYRIIQLKIIIFIVKIRFYTNWKGIGDGESLDSNLKELFLANCADCRLIFASLNGWIGCIALHSLCESSTILNWTKIFFYFIHLSVARYFDFAIFFILKRIILHGNIG